MPRVTPAELEGDVIQTSLLARVMARRPEILKAFARLDLAARHHGLLPSSLKEAVRSATAGETGCTYCASLGEYRPDPTDRRESLAVAFALMMVEDAAGITDAQFDVLREEFTEEEIVELVAFTAFIAIGGQLFGATLKLEAAEPEEAAAYRELVSRRG